MRRRGRFLAAMLVVATAAVVGGGSTAQAAGEARKPAKKLGDKITVSGHPTVGARAGVMLATAVPDGDAITSFTLNFGDRTKVVKGKKPPRSAAHVYSRAGTYTVTLIVTDRRHHSAKATARATIRSAPTASGGGSTGTTPGPGPTAPTAPGGFPPGPVTDLRASAPSATLVHLSWSLPQEGDLSGVTVRRATGTTPPTSSTAGTVVANLPGTATSLDDSSVTSATTYSYAVFTENSASLFSTPAVTSATTPGEPDTTPPGPVTDPWVTTTSTTAALTWTNPTDADLAGIAVVRTTGSTPAATPVDGTLLIDDAPSATTFTDAALTPGQTYTYALFAHDSASNDAEPATLTVTLPDTSGDGSDGVVPLPTTIQPAPDLLQSVTDNPDGSQTIVLGQPVAAPANVFAPATEQQRRASAPAARSTGVGAGGDPCVIYGITHSGDVLNARAIMVPAATTSKYPDGVLGQVTSASPNLSGTQCTVTSANRASIDEAYSSFQHDDKALPIKARYAGDIESADSSKLPFGCKGSSSRSFTTTADFTHTSLEFHTKLNHGAASTSTLSFTLTAKPVFTITLAANSTITCSPDTGGAGLYIPVPGTPLMFELAPDAKLTLSAGATGTVTFSPTLVVSTVKGSSKLTAPKPTFTGTSSATLTASLDLTASLLLGGPVGIGIKGSIGPSLSVPLSGPNAGCGTLSLDESLALTGHLLFTDWNYTLASASQGGLTFGGCTGSAISVSAGVESSCAVLTDGTAQCWGNDSVGELGNGSTSSQPLGPVKVHNLTGAKTIAEGFHHSCALLSDGSVSCWGDNGYGQLGYDGGSSLVPVKVKQVAGAIALTASANFTCALLHGGTVKCWGYGDDGVLGDGDTASSSTPVSVKGLTDVTQISAGETSVCALVKGGAVWCWGRGGDGQLGDSATNDSAVPVRVSGLTAATAVATGWTHACAALANGGVDCWGNNDPYDPPVPMPVAVPGLTGVTALSAEEESTCAVLSDSTIECWGLDDYGQLDNGNEAVDQESGPELALGLDPAAGVAAGGVHYCALSISGHVQCWGADLTGELGDPNAGDTQPVTVPLS